VIQITDCQNPPKMLKCPQETERMSRAKQGAMLLLAVVVLWATVPAAACLLGPRAKGHHACCHAMAAAMIAATTPQCGAQPQGSSCCTASPQQTIVAAEPVFSAEKHLLAIAPVSLGTPLAAEPAFAPLPAVFAVPPPDPPPGSTSILRI
jgi:hypothetical protein